MDETKIKNAKAYLVAMKDLHLKIASETVIFWIEHDKSDWKADSLTHAINEAKQASAIDQLLKVF